MRNNLSNSQQVFLAFLQAGLWEKDVRLESYGETYYSTVLSIAEGQSVVGLVAAGLEHIIGVRPAKKDVLQFVGRVTQLEQRNQSMNYFIGVLTDEMNEAGIEFVLTKGQGVAQCYERPLWRACGDVDLLTDVETYDNAKVLLTPLANSLDDEEPEKKHLGMTIDPWVVELHGTLRSLLWKNVEKTVDDVQRAIFDKEKTRIWLNDGTAVLLPGVDEDAFYIFMHFVAHFFKGGIGLRQICDWCRLLWMYRDSIDKSLLESRLLQAGLLSEWKAFAALAVEYLKMPVDAMPFYAPDSRWRRKASSLMSIILETGNFGHNRDASYYHERSFLVRKAISFWRYTCDSVRHFLIFPKDSTKVWWNRVRQSVSVAVKGR